MKSDHVYPYHPPPPNLSLASKLVGQGMKSPNQDTTLQINVVYPSIYIFLKLIPTSNQDTDSCLPMSKGWNLHQIGDISI